LIKSKFKMRHLQKLQIVLQSLYAKRM